MFATFKFYVGKWESYGIYISSYIFHVFYVSASRHNILWQLTRGVDKLPDRVCSHGCFLCVDACHPCIIIFCYFLYITFVTWYRLSVGSFCMSLWFCWVSHHQALFWDRWVNMDWIGLDYYYDRYYLKMYDNHVTAIHHFYQPWTPSQHAQQVESCPRNC